MISQFSFLMGVFWCNIFLAIVFVYRNKENSLNRCIYWMIMAILLGLLRLVLPLDFPFSTVIRSYNILPQFMQLLNSPILGTGLTLINFILIIWIAGIILFAALSLFEVIRSFLYRKTITPLSVDNIETVINQVVSDNPKLKKCTIVVTDQIAVPQIIGYVYPKIYLPNYNLSSNQWYHIISHELGHYIYGDLWIKLAYSIICIIFWWNPLVKTIKSELDLLLEIGCDLKITKRLTDSDSLDYISTLIEIAKRVNVGKDLRMPINTLGFVGENTRKNSILQYRAQAIIDKRETKSNRSAFPQAVIIGAFLLSFMVVVQPAGQPIEQDVTDAMMINTDNLHINLYDNGKMYLVIDGIEFCEVNGEALTTFPYSELKIINKEG